ncbi:MAG TPA: DUF4363 family protein [Clostridia bacterium]|nr:DUF4363 family protein [Clostridia bacterium]
MRIIVFTVALLVLIIAMSWYGTAYLEASAGALLELLQTVESQIQTGNWTATEATLHRVTELWNETHLFWKILIDHRETDEIETALTRLQSFAAIHRQGEALSELAVLRFRLQHIPAKERLLLSNIF